MQQIDAEMKAKDCAIAELKVECDEQKLKVIELELEIAAKQTDLVVEQGENAHLQQQLSACIRKSRIIDQELTSMAASKEALEYQLQMAANDAERITQELAATTASKQELARQLQTATEDADSIAQKLAAKEIDVQHLTSAQTTLEEQLDKYVVALNQIQKSVQQRLTPKKRKRNNAEDEEDELSETDEDE